MEEHGLIQESGPIEIIPLICILTIWGQYPDFLHPESTQVHIWGWLQWLSVCLHPEFPQGSLSSICNVMAWWLQHPLFTDMASNIFHSHLEEDVETILVSLFFYRVEDQEPDIKYHV